MVKKIKWKDFEIADLQPNLIPNGWDSFEPHGSGKNYVDNWDFSSDDLSKWTPTYGMQEIRNGIYTTWSINPTDASRAEYKETLEKGKYMARVKIRSSHKVRIRRWDNTDLEDLELEPSSVFEVIEKEVNVLDSEEPTYFRFYMESKAAAKDQVIEIDWFSISKADDQHLVVEKTPLENGLTRIQTWGGNNVIKLRSISLDHLSNDIEYNTSILLNNIGSNVVEYWAWGYNKIGVVKPSEEEYITLNRSPVESRHDIRIRATNKNNNLDFIASEPQVVEGDKHNPALIVTELDNGQEHVQVYGAYPDTELVYKGGGAIIGEPYVIESEIENLGGQLQMETTLDSTGQVIDKGINQVNIKGTTDSKDFEIGVKLRDGTI